MATALRSQKATQVPLVFVEGDPEKTARVKALLPDAACTTWRGLAVRKALATKTKAKPVLPGTMADSSGTPLPRKLGIRPGSAVVLLGAPQGFEGDTLGQLPEGKIAAIDATWSGLCFAQRRARS